jgi:hypothetical protein
MDTISYPFPNEFFDDEGYPTQESLDYIKNWTYAENKFGQYFGKGMYDELIEYLRNIWVYEDDAIGYEDGLLDLHTYGWSGNEDIVGVLKDTDLWTIKFRCEQTGGHYYFQIEEFTKGYDWRVEKVKLN